MAASVMSQEHPSLSAFNRPLVQSARTRRGLIPSTEAACLVLYTFILKLYHTRYNLSRGEYIG